MHDSLAQQDLFSERRLPDGLLYRPDFITARQERLLLDWIAGLPLKEAAYRQYLARRRVASFGSQFDYENNRRLPAAPIPSFLDALKAQAAAWAGLAPEDFAQALVAEYRPGTALGWHRDVPDYEVVVGISLGGPCRMRFRPYPPHSATAVQSFQLHLEPRSAYVLRGEARWRWQHGIPATKSLRYSISLRTFSDSGRSSG